MIAVLAGVVAHAGAVQLDRVDLLSETPGTWLAFEAPRALDRPEVAAVRFVGQVSPVIAIAPKSPGAARLELAASLEAQSVGIAAPLDRDVPVTLDAAVVGRAFLPTGLRAGVGWRVGRLRLGMSVVAMSDATWIRPQWSGFAFYPAIGVGIGRYRAPGAPWMR